MTPTVCIAIAPRTMRALMDFQRDHSKEGELCELADQAIHDWLAHQLELEQAIGTVHNAWSAIYIQMPGERAWTQAQRLRRALEESERLASLPHLPRRSQPPAPGAGPPSATRTLPQDVLPTPQLRHDRSERRHAYRRAEDLLLD